MPSLSLPHPPSPLLFSMTIQERLLFVAWQMARSNLPHSTHFILEKAMTDKIFFFFFKKCLKNLAHERGPCEVWVMLSGATAGVGEGSTEASCEFSFLFLPSNEGACRHTKNLTSTGAGGGLCTRHIGHSGWEKCGHWWKFTAAKLKSTFNKCCIHLRIHTREKVKLNAICLHLNKFRFE